MAQPRPTCLDLLQLRLIEVFVFLVKTRQETLKRDAIALGFVGLASAIKQGLQAV
jgi:hypothetical protein